MSGFELDPTVLSRENPVTFDGPSGTVEGLWRPPRLGVSPRGVAVVAHPHPAFGGTMLNKVVFHTARVLNHDLNIATLRFNFRGVGKSAGQYDEGRGEQDDLRAAWVEARSRVPDGPFIAAGFSFGAAMTLLLAASELTPGETPDALALLGIPFRLFPPPETLPHRLPLVAAHGELDQFTPPERVRAYLDAWPAPHAFHVEPEADHFFETRLAPATRFLSRHLHTWLFDGITAR